RNGSVHGPRAGFARLGRDRRADRRLRNRRGPLHAADRPAPLGRPPITRHPGRRPQRPAGPLAARPASRSPRAAQRPVPEVPLETAGGAISPGPVGPLGPQQLPRGAWDASRPRLLNPAVSRSVRRSDHPVNFWNPNVLIIFIFIFLNANR